MYELVAERLRERGHEVERILRLEDVDRQPADHDFLISHGRVPPDWRAAIPCRGGPGWSRVELLRLLERHRLRTMTWDLAADHAAVTALFDRWGVERLLLKRSDTCGGRATEVFDRTYVPALDWDPAQDVFCAEVDPADGTVYKIEAFDGVETISWRRHSPPLGEMFEGPHLLGVRELQGTERDLWAPPRRLRARVLAASRTARRRGVGYMSFDFMRDPAGRYRAIEANDELVATWWTGQFPWVRARYAERLAAQRVFRTRRRPARIRAPR